MVLSCLMVLLWLLMLSLCGVVVVGVAVVVVVGGVNGICCGCTGGIVVKLSLLVRRCSFPNQFLHLLHFKNCIRIQLQCGNTLQQL